MYRGCKRYAVRQVHESLVRVHGHFVQVAVPEEPVSVNVMTLAKGGINYMGTLTGSLQEIQEMLDFASKE